MAIGLIKCMNLGGGGGDTKSTRIFCMGVHNILSVGGTKYPRGLRYILGYFVGGGYNILGGTKYPVTVGSKFKFGY